MSCAPIKLLFLLAIVVLVKADYTIDDQNKTVSYSTGGNWFHSTTSEEEQLLVNGSYITIITDDCFDDSYPGSGATVYVKTAGMEGVNASITIDGDASSTNYSSLPSTPPAYQTANVSLFSVQGLVSGSHTIDLRVVDYQGSWSNMFLDSIAINETLVTAPATSSTSSSLTSTSSASSTASTSASSVATPHKSSNVGAIAGGVVGGLAVIGLALVLFLWRRSRMRPDNTSHSGEKDYRPPQSHQNNLRSGLPISVPPNEDPSTAPYIQLQEEQSTYSPYSPSRASAQMPQDRFEPSSAILSGGLPIEKHTSYNPETVLSPEGASMRLPVGVQSASHGASLAQAGFTAGPARLSDEQADFINTLHRNNIPADAISRVMERMLGGALPSAMRGQDWMAESGVEDLAPPSYA
ncbi:hypothetical protein HWV62_11986 [Athelia sp. TMB]|nr:hypothetical protein HWV62_11986 [Athelia sp. TMB]